MNKHKTIWIMITREIQVDECIADEIIVLNAKGVKTVASCCGHGEAKPHAIIFPSSQSCAKMWGYEPYMQNDNVFIDLKSKCKCKNKEEE